MSDIVPAQLRKSINAREAMEQMEQILAINGVRIEMYAPDYSMNYKGGYALVDGRGAIAKLDFELGFQVPIQEFIAEVRKAIVKLKGRIIDPRTSMLNG